MEIIKPTGNKVLIKKVAEEEKTKGGVILVGNAKELPQQATVVAIGPDVTQVNIEDLILFSKFSGIDVKVETESYVVLSEDDILAVIENDKR